MSFLKKTLGFMAVLAIFPAAFAATARPSIITTASSRLPTMTAQISGTASTANSTSTATTLATQECVEAYTSCLKGAEVCGQNFEECTNKTLFFSKKALCASTLMQCSTTGITNLFGSATQTAFANKNTAGDYIYPTDGSTLGQMIEAAHISNRYDTSQCVRRYTTCLKKDDVCGADFELCTSNTEFKKQKLFCESTLARCQDDGLKELFGTTSTSANPTASSRIGVMVTEGAALAAVNAVATCYKVADTCILNACAQNPHKCKEGSNRNLVNTAQQIITDAEGNTNTIIEKVYAVDAVERSEIAGYIKNACQDTIGANKYCYATFIGNGAMPTNAQLKDEDNRGEIYAEAYSSRMNSSMMSKIDDLIEQFEQKTIKQCRDTLVSCAMQSCGDGYGSTCYSSAFNPANSYKTVAFSKGSANDPWDQIVTGCSAVVNNDNYCKYAVATFDTKVGTVMFEDRNSLMEKVFPKADGSKNDPIGAIAELDAKLSTTYSQAGLDQMKRQCQTVATGCVKTMCGTDYSNCYRNRTDVYSTLTNTGSEAFDKSMNKVGGVLDYTVVLGLCLNTVKANPVCEEHIRSEAARTAVGNGTASVWGGATSARDGWLGAGVYSATASTSTYQDIDADGNLLCTTSANGGGQIGRCDDISGTYIYPYMISETSYNIAQAERTIFRDLVYDLEKEAQAIYNSKLTKQQNLCLQGNNGGIVGTKDLGGTFQWVKLRNNKVPKEYTTKGLTTNQFVSSNELYGSFCRIRVTLQSDDKKIQDAISSGKDWGTAYFAAGDTFTCGSWIPEKALTDISNRVAAEKSGTSAGGALKSGQKWAVVGTSLLGAVGGGVAMNALQNGKLGGLLGTVKQVDTPRAKNLKECITKVDESMRGITDTSLNYELTEELIGTGTDAVTCRIYKAAAAAPVANNQSQQNKQQNNGTFGNCAFGTRWSKALNSCVNCDSSVLLCSGGNALPTCVDGLTKEWSQDREICVDKNSPQTCANMGNNMLKYYFNTYTRTCEMCTGDAACNNGYIACTNGQAFNHETKKCDGTSSTPNTVTTPVATTPLTDANQCPADNPRLRSLNASNKVGDNCTYGNVTKGRVYKITSGANAGTCSCTALECNKGSYLSGGRCLDCPTGRTCPGGTAGYSDQSAAVVTTCAVNTYKNKNGNCVSCPSNASCAGGNALPVCKSGQWDSLSDSCIGETSPNPVTNFDWNSALPNYGDFNTPIWQQK